MDEPRRPRRDARAGVRGRRHLRRRAVRDRHRRGRQALQPDVPPRGRAHARRRQAARQFRAPRVRLRRRLDDGELQGCQDRRHPRAGRQGPGDLRPVGRGRQRGRRGADPRGDRRPADLRVRRPRPDAPRRGGAGRHRCSAISYNIPLVHVDAERRLPRRARRRHRPREAKRKFIGAELHRRVRGRGEEDRRRRLPRPGHALSRRDRERQLHRRAVGDDQEPPQCRRPARADEHEAGRAAARAVQGRGARARPRARPARGVRRPPPVPRARASPSAFPAR